MAVMWLMAGVVVGGFLLMFGLWQLNGWAVAGGAICIALSFILGARGNGQRQASS